MHNTLKILSICLLSGLLLSCEDVFNQRVFIQIDPGPEKLVLLTNFENQNSPRVLLTLSGNDFDDYYNYKGNYKLAPPAEIEVFEEGNSLGKMIPDTLSTYVFADRSILPKAGKNYEIRVNSDEYGPIWAKNSIPEIIPFTAELTGNKKKIFFMGREFDTHEIKLSFNDPASVKNNYRLRVSHIFENQDTSINTTFSYIFSSDYVFRSESFAFGNESEALRYITGHKIFTDTQFNGTTKDILIYVHIASPDSGEKVFANIAYSLENLSKDTYEYEFTRNQAFNNEGNPFVQPTIIHNNIKGGGLGAFNAYSTQSGTIMVQN